MTDGLHITVEGLRELRAELRAAADAMPREMRTLGQHGSRRLHEATVRATPVRTGKMAAQWRPFATQRGFGVRSRHPGAGVIEFADHEYPRRTPSGGTTTVQPPSGIGSAPRMAYRVGPPLSEVLFADFVAALDELLRLHGWGEVTG